MFLGLCVAIILFSACSNSQSNAEPRVKEPVIFFSGGCVDDFVVHMLLLGMDHIDLKGIILTNADNIYPSAMDAHWKIAQFCNRTDVPIALSNARGWNPFPYVYRKISIPFNQIPILMDLFPNPDWPPFPSGEQLLEELLKSAADGDHPLTLLVTAPMTALKNALVKNEVLKEGIQRVVFMGGAIHVPGNLDPKTIPLEIANEAAEWNIFWDPASVSWIFENTSFEIILFPLDVTNQAAITLELREKLRVQGEIYNWSKVASQGYEITLDDPDTFYLWNSSTACYLGRPELYRNPVRLKLGVLTEWYEQGAVEERSSGREVNVVFEFEDIDGFYNYFLELLKR
jgi:purine nucleosidase